jgi:hypothetical protein
MLKICELHFLTDAIMLTVPPQGDEEIERNYAYRNDDKDMMVALMWDIAELCGIQDQVRITKARRRKE